MKKSLAVIAICVLSLCACSGTENASEERVETSISEQSGEIKTEEESVEESSESESEENVKESNESESDEPNSNESSSARILDVVMRSTFYTVDGDINASLSHQFPVLLGDDATEYEELYNSLIEIGSAYIAETDASREFMLETVEELLAEGTIDENLSFSDERTSYLMRADSEMVSMLVYNTSYTGGAHGSQIYSVHNFDSQTGERLTFSDVITDEAALMDIVQNKLEEEYSESYEEFYDIDASMEAYKGDSSTLIWAMTSNGIVIIFNEEDLGTYAASSQIINVRFDEAPDLFVDQYKNVAAEYVIPVIEGDTYTLNIDGNDVNVKLSAEGSANGIIYKVQMDEDAFMLSDSGHTAESYIVYVDGKYYFYVSISEEDLRLNYFVDLQTFSFSEEDLITGDLYESSLAYEDDSENAHELVFDISPFINPNNFAISQSINSVGVSEGVEYYHVGSTGIPEAN